ncbi:hypothetical protein ACH4E8_22980 [Streptomyces sp. NPDC017979]|uniref:hypothetical protein n=1 Tax=Streptomyces sp. NPDC017979 TaxID=3365024 RepID=UPI003792B708
MTRTTYARLILTALGTTALAVTFPTGTAVADETRNGHQLTLVSIGQIDDPAEDVLEHAVILKDAAILSPTHHHHHPGAEPAAEPASEPAAEPAAESPAPEAAEAPEAVEAAEGPAAE